MNQTCENGRTPLMYAIGSGWVHVVEFLLEFGVDTDVADDRHTTALMQSCSLGLSTIVRLLLDHRADVNSVCLVVIAFLVHADLKKRGSTFVSITLENLDDFNKFYIYLETGMNALCNKLFTYLLYL